MKKIVNFAKDFVGFFITVFLVLWIENRMGWTETNQSTIDTIISTVIGLAIGWIVWKIFVTLIEKRNQCRMTREKS